MPIFVAEAAVGVSSPAVAADQRRRGARFPCSLRGRRLPKKAADVGRTLDERAGNRSGRLNDRARAAAARRVGAAGGRRSPQRPTASGHAAVQPVMPRLPHQAADDEPALRSRTVAKFVGRTGGGDAGGHQQRHPSHAGLQIPFRARTNRSDRCVPQNDTHPARAGDPGAPSG